MGRRHRRAAPVFIGLAARSPASASLPMLLTSAAVLALLTATLQGYREFWMSVLSFVLPILREREIQTRFGFP